MSINVIISLSITICGFIINIGMLIWNMSKLNSKVNYLEKEHSEQATKFESFRKEYRDGHDSLRERFDNKLEELMEKVDKKLEEQGAQLLNITATVTRMEAGMTRRAGE
jgi:biopolymer transport protein ExbB/TolQ